MGWASRNTPSNTLSMLACLVVRLVALRIVNSSTGHDEIMQVNYLPTALFNYPASCQPASTSAPAPAPAPPESSCQSPNPRLTWSEVEILGLGPRSARSCRFWRSPTYLRTIGRFQCLGSAYLATLLPCPGTLVAIIDNAFLGSIYNSQPKGDIDTTRQNNARQD